MITLTEFVDSLPADTVSLLSFSERVRLVRELYAVDAEILSDIESLPHSLQLAASFVKALEEFKAARRADR